MVNAVVCEEDFFFPCKMKRFLPSDRTLLKVVHLIAILPARSCSLEYRLLSEVKWLGINGIMPLALQC